jgi:hypothetical protein
MAFSRANFANNGMGGGNSAPKIFSYNGTADTKAAVIANSFFDGVADYLTVGDIIFSTTTTVPVALYVVSISAANVVVTGYVAIA